MKRLILIIISFVTLLSASADDKITMLTRHGDILDIKLERVTADEVYFYDKKAKKRGMLAAPKDFIYMIKNEKGNTVFFLDNGTQVTHKSVKVKPKDDVLYLIDGQELVVYDLRPTTKGFTFRTKKNKHAEVYSVQKNHLFMIRYSDGYCDIYGAPYKAKQPNDAALAQQEYEYTPAPAPQPSAINTPSAPGAQTDVVEIPIGANQAPATPVATATQPSQKAISAAFGVFPEKVIDLVYRAKPYTLFKKGAVAEYVFAKDGKYTKYCGAHYLLQKIIDAKVEDGLYVAYLQQDMLNENRQRPLSLDKRYLDAIFVTEIDTAGTFQWTHDPMRSQMVVEKKRGYASLIHNDLWIGQLPSSIMELTGSSHLSGRDATSSAGGLNSKKSSTQVVQYDYSGLQMTGTEHVATPCGTYDCIRISGPVTAIQPNGSTKASHTTLWLARDIGIIRCDIDVDNNGHPISMLLNKIYNND